MKKFQILKNKILNLDDLETEIPKWRNNHEKIVFTNGCFDLIHVGHIEYLAKAADLGDKLVIGLNTDDSVKRLKGPNRPVLDQQARAETLAALFFVDAVIFFDEDTPYELIKIIKPDILVKGGDYQIDDIVGADIVKNYGGVVETIPLVQGYSTSNIIEKILKLNK
jgi:rfaE bifunctional protein nucleotidyltransferase chain/domain